MVNNRLPTEALQAKIPTANEAMVDHNEKAERYWTLMRKYQDLAGQAELPFLGDIYRKVAKRYGAMAREALDLAVAEKQRKRRGSQPSGEG
jgi:hypothetical protein